MTVEQIIVLVSVLHLRISQWNGPCYGLGPWRGGQMVWLDDAKENGKNSKEGTRSSWIVSYLTDHIYWEYEKDRCGNRTARRAMIQLSILIYFLLLNLRRIWNILGIHIWKHCKAEMVKISNKLQTWHKPRSVSTCWRMTPVGML